MKGPWDEGGGKPQPGGLIPHMGKGFIMFIIIIWCHIA